MATSLIEKTACFFLNPSSKTPVLNEVTKITNQNNHNFKHIHVIKGLSKAKSSIFLVKSKTNGQIYAMKVFDYNELKPHDHFENEIRFSFLDHPNIIKTHHIKHEKQILYKGNEKKISYIILEYAPHGDFLDFVINHSQSIDDKLIRTFFRQLIQGLEYLHKFGVSHLDLKLKNLLLGSDFNLKIADFDLSSLYGDKKILSRGTRFYRAPELIHGKCDKTQPADIYSAGIVLFVLKTRGVLPHKEDDCVDGIDFGGLLYSQNEEFWSKHCEVQKKDASFFDEDFKELFNAMVSLDPNKRPTVRQIENTKWFNGPFYTDEELKTKMKEILAPINFNF